MEDSKSCNGGSLKVQQSLLDRRDLGGYNVGRGGSQFRWRIHLDLLLEDLQLRIAYKLGC
jgi:hypothetical protein